MINLVVMGTVILSLFFIAWYEARRKRQDRKLLDVMERLLGVAEGFEQRNGERRMNGYASEEREDV